MKAVLFDLDGTLLNTLKDIAESANRILTRYNFPIHPVKEYQTFVGEGVKKLIFNILPEEARGSIDLPAMAAEFVEIYRNNWDTTSCPYEGIIELLIRLNEKKIPMAIVSNKPDDFTKMHAEKLLPGIPFRVVRGAIEGRPAKPDPESLLETANLMNIPPRECFFVGDTSVDMKAAIQAGMTPIGVSWGFRGAAELIEAGAQHIAHTAGELADLILSI